MEKAGIISKLDHNTPTPWLNSYLIVKKANGSLRICLDPTDLNKYIVRPVCNSHTLDDVSHLLKDAKYFSVFDATKGFFHLPIDALSTVDCDAHPRRCLCVQCPSNGTLQCRGSI